HSTGRSSACRRSWQDCISSSVCGFSENAKHDWPTSYELSHAESAEVATDSLCVLSAICVKRREETPTITGKPHNIARMSSNIMDTSSNVARMAHNIMGISPNIARMSTNIV